MVKKFERATEEEIERRRAFYRGEYRSIGLKNAELWNQMFPEWGVNALSPNTSVPRAQRLSIVYTCLNVLGETRGSLPCEVKQNTAAGRVTVSSDPVYRLVHDRPNPFMTAFDFWSTVEKLKKAWGNCYAEIIRDKSHSPVSLWIRLPWLVTLRITASGELYYLFEGRQIPATDMLHFKNYSMDGLHGVSTIKQNALSIEMGLKLKEYNSNIITDRPPGFLTTEVKPKDQQAKSNIGGMWADKGKKEISTTVPSTGQTTTMHVGTALKIPILYGGVTYQQLSLPADDVAYIESTNLTNTDIYGIFRVPPTFGQDWKNTPYNGAEQQDLIMGKYTLAGMRGDEQECTEKLFPESNKYAENSLYIKFNLKGLLQGDHATRQKFYTAMFNISALNANEIREMEDLPHYPDGNKYYVQGALVPVDQIADMIEAQIKAGDQKDKKEPPPDKEAQRAEIMEELNVQLRSRLNGHYKDVADLFQ